MTENNKLLHIIGDLAKELAASQPEIEQKQSFEEIIERNELQENGATPYWLIDLLSAVKDKKLTGNWVDFTRDAGDDTNVFDFIRELDQVLPIRYENNEESWLLTFPQLNLEACISFEGSCYKVSHIGDTWELEKEES